MELRELNAFREVAQQVSFSRAAARLGYVQSTVSAQIAALEADLGVRLIDRLGRTIALTAAGEALLPMAEQVLELADEARAQVNAVSADGRELTGRVAVSAPESLLTYRLPEVLRRFHEDAPSVTIDLQPTPIGRFRGDTRRAIAGGSVDLGFVLDARLEHSGFTSKVLRREEINVVAPIGHALSRSSSVVPADLVDMAILLPEAPESGCEYRGQFERQLADAAIRLDDALEFTSIETVKQCVIAGMGIAVLPAVAIETELAAGRLARLAWAEPFEVYTQIVWNERRSLSPTQQAFIECARNVLADPTIGASMPRQA
jgi:DNA-binding transcriptional LysR family regulator